MNSRKFFWWKKPMTEYSPASGSAEKASDSNGEGAALGFSPDTPLSNPTLDRFSRFPFASRVAQIIKDRIDPSSLVVGIYGPWGEGKTTVLNFIRSEFVKMPRIVTVSFNPWRFGDESVLLTSFFETLASALQGSITTKKENVGKLLKEYGGFASTISSPLSKLISHGTVEINAGKSLETIGELLSDVTLEQLKARVEKILSDSGKRVVILMDDIDRLEKSEIQAIFKLVKLTADFKYTAYVLAFDDEMVAAAVGERFVSSEKDVVRAGRKFLEKIVQVPLHLPKAPIPELRAFCFEAVDEALTTAGIQLSTSQAQSFAKDFIESFESSLATPRMAKRYGNVLQFAMGILKDEVHPVDMMLIEALRIFFPETYEAVRDSEGVVLAKAVYLDDQQYRTEAREFLNRVTEGMSIPHRKAVEKILGKLFPLMGVGRRNNYLLQDAEKNQRIFSGAYFPRYFSYAIPRGDVADSSITELIRIADAANDSDTRKLLQTHLNTSTAEPIVTKLRLRYSEISMTASHILINVFLPLGGMFPRGRESSFLSPFANAALLIQNLIANLPREERLPACIEAVAKAEPPEFSAEFVIWLVSDEGTQENERFLTKEEETAVFKAIAVRIQQVMTNHADRYELSRRDTSLFVHLWERQGDKAALAEFLHNRLATDAGEAISLLISFLPVAQSSDGTTRHGDLQFEQFQAVSKAIDPDVVIAALSKALPDTDLENPEYRNDHRTFNARVASQFAFFAKQRKAETTKEATTEGQKDGNNDEK